MIAEHIIRPKIVDDGLFRTSRYARSMATVVATFKRESSVGLEKPFGVVSHTRRMLPAAVERRMKRSMAPYGGHRRQGGMPW